MKKLLFFSSVCLLILLLLGCTHQGNGKLPKVKTGNIIVQAFEATSDGTCVRGMIGGLIDANGAVVVKYGVCYSTTNNKPTMYNDDNPNGGGGYDYSSVYGTLSGSQVQSVTRQFVVPYNKKLYARAYALTADGEEVYGKTITFDPNEEHEDQRAYLLSRPNGWKLSSSSGSLEWWEPANHTLVFNRNGVLDYLGMNPIGAAHWHLNYASDYSFIGGDSPYDNNSEILPQYDLLRYEGWYDYEGLNPSGQYVVSVGGTFMAKILNLNKNELKIGRINFSDDGDVIFVEFTYVPAP